MANGKIDQINSKEWGVITDDTGGAPHPVHASQVQGYESGFTVGAAGAMGRKHTLAGSAVIFNPARTGVVGLELRVGSGGRIAGREVGTSVTGVSIV